MPCIRHPPVINGRGTCFFGKTNETCSFSCNPGFDFRGSKMRRCQANHTWDGSLPTCSSMLTETEILYFLFHTIDTIKAKYPGIIFVNTVCNQ